MRGAAEAVTAKGGRGSHAVPVGAVPRHLCLALIALIALLAATPTVRAQPVSPARTLRPLDEASRDPELARLRDGVLGAARAHDITRLLPFLAPSVVVYSANTPREQVAVWLASQPPPVRARFWDTLRDAFTLGMAYERGANAPMLLAPYTGAILSAIPNDVSEHYAIVDAGVAVHRDPDESSPVIARVGHEVVDAASSASAQPLSAAVAGANEWRQIRTSSGQLGWVLSQHARSAYDTRFSIERVDGIWKLTGWATGE